MLHHKGIIFLIISFFLLMYASPAQTQVQDNLYTEITRIHGGYTQDAILSDDGDHLLVRTSVNVFIYDTLTLELIGAYPIEGTYPTIENYRTYVDWIDSGSNITIIQPNGTIAIHNIFNGLQKEFQISQPAKIDVVGLSKNGEYFATGDENGLVHIWNWNNLEAPIQTLSFSEVIVSIKWCPDETQILVVSPNHLFISSIDGDIRATDIQNIRSVECLSTGMDILVEYNLETTIYDLETLKPKNTFSRITDIAWTSDGDWIATSGSNTNIFHKNELIETINHEERSESIAWSTDGSHLATATNNEIMIWHVEDQTKIFYQPININVADSIISIIWSQDDSTLFLVTIYGSVYIWNWQDDIFLGKLNEPSIGLYVKAWAHDAPILALGGYAGRVEVWSLTNPNEPNLT